MTNGKAKILVLVEGSRLDAHVMRLLIDLYGISEKHEVVSYDTNIYTLYGEMFKNGDPDSYDLLQLLKEREKYDGLKEIFDQDYSDILLVFDLDPQDPLYQDFKIREMLEYFSESTDKGKLYINYPMIEAFYHMETIPDMNFNSYTVELGDLKKKLYKDRVHQLTGYNKLDNIAITKEQCDLIIKSNINKAGKIVGINECEVVPDGLAILEEQLKTLKMSEFVYVLSTCPFYIVDYNPSFIFRN